jgi:hypothetical protein
LSVNLQRAVRNLPRTSNPAPEGTAMNQLRLLLLPLTVAIVATALLIAAAL